MMKVFHLTAMLLVLLVSPIYGQSVEETIESLENAISELQDELDGLEQYRYESDVDLLSALSSVKKAKATMRSVAISLLIESIDHRKKGDYERVIKALKILKPEIFDQERSRNDRKKK